MTNAEVAREISYQLKKYPTDAEIAAAQRVLDKAYPPLPGDLGEMVKEARAVIDQHWQLPDRIPPIIAQLQRLCDALEAHSAPTKAGDE